MVESTTRFFVRALCAGAAIILLLAAGMTLATNRLETAASAQIARVRAAEDRITCVERLRWSAELIVSAGRGYLIAADASMIPQLRAAEERFDEGVGALRGEALSPQGALLMAEAERAATEFRHVQKQLLGARRHTDTDALAQAFEAELVPRREALEAALEGLVIHKKRAIDVVYRDIERDRERLTLQKYGLLVMLVVSASTITWTFADRLARAYRQEQEALAAARQALSSRNEIMGILAHDLRNPLAAISMKATLLLRLVDADKPRRVTESIQKVARRMGHLVNSTLDAAALEAGGLTIAVSTCDADSLLCDVSELFGDLAAANRIRLELTTPPALQLRADRERVLEVLSNLIDNALKFTPPGGRVAVSVERSGGMARFAVSDTGPGIAPDHLAHLFDRFWKHEVAGRKGTGLGLFIVKGIVEAHGGRIWAESEPGRGATFVFTLPLAEQPRHDVA